MKASRAPGPISYSQRHQQKDNRVRSSDADLKKKHVVTGGERLTRYKEIDFAGDSDNAWSSLDANIFQMENASSEYASHPNHHTMQSSESSIENHISSSAGSVDFRSLDRSQPGQRSAPAANWHNMSTQKDFSSNTSYFRNVDGNATAPAACSQQAEWGIDAQHDVGFDSANNVDFKANLENGYDYDDYSDEEPPVIPVRDSGKFGAPKRVNFGNNDPVELPPLPCESSNNTIIKSDHKMTDEEKLYFGRKPRSVDFKPYTLSQYKMIKPKEYVEISNMKPDLNSEELVAKRKNLERIKEFSKQLRHFNQEVITQQPKKPSAIEENDLQVAKLKHESNRQRGLEFSRNVAKPKVAESKVTQSSRATARNDSNAAVVGLHMDEDAIISAKLEELERKHLQNKAKMESIRNSVAPR